MVSLSLAHCKTVVPCREWQGREAESMQEASECRLKRELLTLTSSPAFHQAGQEQRLLQVRIPFIAGRSNGSENNNPLPADSKPSTSAVVRAKPTTTRASD